MNLEDGEDDEGEDGEEEGEEEGEEDEGEGGEEERMMERRREGWRGGGRNRRSRGREPIRINTVDLAERPVNFADSFTPRTWSLEGPQSHRDLESLVNLFKTGLE